MHLEGGSTDHRAMGSIRQARLRRGVESKEVPPFLNPFGAAGAGLRFACRSAFGRAGFPAPAGPWIHSLIVTSCRFASHRERLPSGKPALPKAERSELITLVINSDLKKGGGRDHRDLRAARGARAPLVPLPRGAGSIGRPPFAWYREIISLRA